MMPRRSFYDLCLTADPGGAQTDQHHLRGSLDELRGDLDALLSRGLTLYLLCWYGASLKLDVFQRGALMQSIDLRPHLTITIEGYPELTFDAEGKVRGYDFTRKDDDADDDDADDDDADDDDADEGSLADQLFSGALEDVTEARLGWEAIVVPALEGEVAREGDLLNIDGDWLDDEARFTEEELLEQGYLRYGVTDRADG